MLNAASRPDDDFATDIEQGRTDSPVRSIAPVASLSVTSRYGSNSRPNIPAILLILAIHVVALAAIIQVRSHVLRAQETKLTVVNLSPPPPPPASETPPPPPSTPQVVAPPPVVQTPALPVPVQTTPLPMAVPVPVAPASAPSAVPAPASAPSAPPSMVQGGDLGTQMVSGKPPRYPIESRRKREQGTVVLSLVLGVDGAVDSLAVAQSSGFNRLDNAARDAVKGWRWRPTIRDGQPVRVKGVVEIPFVLRSDAT